MQWEYFVHTLGTGGLFTTGNFSGPEVSRMLNWYAGQGWEFVSNFSAAAGNGGTISIGFIFKRPKQPGLQPPQAHV
jgi:hypothetical protein